MFRFTQEPSSGSSLCLAKTTEYGFSVLVDIDAINVMAAYQSVVQAYSSQWRQAGSLPVCLPVCLSVSTVNCTPAQQADMPP